MTGEDEREAEAGKWEMCISGRRAGGRKLLRRSSPRECCMEDKAKGHIPHRRKQPTMAVLRTGGERDTDGQKEGCRYLRDISKKESSIKQCSFSEIFLERTLEFQTSAERRSSNSEQSRRGK